MPPDPDPDPDPGPGSDPAAMERQREVRALLKRWEAEFLREQRRKPSQADIAAAPEETRRLYREYRMLKELGKALDPCGRAESQETPPVEQDLGFWGSHLNRKPKIPGKSRSSSAESGMSAQFYGMKLKSKLGGATGKEPPLTPRRTPNPRRIPGIPKFRPNSEPPPSEEESGKPGDSQDPGDSRDSQELLLPPSLPPLLLPSGIQPPSPAHPEKFQRLKQRVAQTLGSLDPAWLQRCQETAGNEGIPAASPWEQRGECTAGTSMGNSRRESPPGNAGGELEDPEKLRRGQDLNEEKLGMKRSQEEEQEEIPKGDGEMLGKILEEEDKEKHREAPWKSRKRLDRLENIPGEEEGEEKQLEAPRKRRKTPKLLENLEEEEEEPMEAPRKRRKTPKLLENLLEEEEPMEAPRKGRKTPKLLENLLEEEEPMEAPRKRRKTPKLENLEEEEEEQDKPKPSLHPRRSRGNFVRLNLRRKRYVRGPALRGNSLRKQVWKEKWRKKSQRFGGGGSDVCFRCGKKGHWAAECPGRDLGWPPMEKDPKEEEEEEEPLPTLEEVARRTNSVFPGILGSASSGPGSSLETPNSRDSQRLECDPSGSLGWESSQNTLEEPNSLDSWGWECDPCPALAPVEPLYVPGEDGKIPDPPPEVLAVLRDLGFSAFRPGQAETVMRILCGLSTLLVSPTGTGKSLCFQLPALLFHRHSRSIAIVVSPLVALMDDQVSELPPGLSAVCVHSGMAPAQRDAAWEKVCSGSAQLFLVSPEALVAGWAFPKFRARFPPVAFACLDEAHCVSRWAHNFRPCFLRLGKVLRDQLGVRCFLALTATATAATARDVAQHLGIPEDSRILVGSSVIPENLRLSVSVEQHRDEALLSLLRREPFSSMASLLVFCTRREDTERVAALIGSQIPGNPKARIPCVPAAPYHAGLRGGARRRLQRQFQRGRVRVLVATSAFGLGLHKPDLRGVIHYSLPGDMEGFVQHSGRAGRDGNAAWCHLFLEPQGQDLPELRRHIYSNTLEFWAVKKFLLEVFAPCRCRESPRKIQGGNSQAGIQEEEKLERDLENPLENPLAKPPGRCRGHERALNVQEMSERLDMSREGMETLLCSLELLPRAPLRLLLPTLARCRLRCAGGARQLRDGARRCPPLAAFLARERQAGRDVGNSGSVEFDVVELSDSMGWESGLVKRELRSLQWGERGGRSGISVQFQGLSLHVVARGDVAGPELDSLCQALLGDSAARERAALRRLRACLRAFQSVAFQGCETEPPEQELQSRSTRLRDTIQEYFQREGPGARDEEEEERMEKEEEELGRERLRDWESCVRSDIRHLLATHPEEKFSGRAIARIFHGIGSPRFPAEIYGRDRRFWRKHLQLDFHGLARLATQEILGQP